MLKSLRSKFHSFKSLYHVYDNWIGILRVHFFGGETTASLNVPYSGKLHFRVSQRNAWEATELSNVLLMFKDLRYDIRKGEAVHRIMMKTPFFAQEELRLLDALMVLSNYAKAISRFDDNYIIVTDIDGAKWIVRNKLPVTMWGDVLFGPLLQYYQEPEEYGWFLKALKESEKEHVFVDVGANVGGFSVRAGKMGARVIAVEPDPDNYRVLKLNLELNQCIRYHAFNIAAGSKEETHQLYGDSTVGYSLKQVKGIQTKCLVKVKPLDVALRSLLNGQEIDLLKVDVEGLELEVLKGAKGLLKRTRYIMVEVSPITEARMREVLDLLRPFGFELIDKVCRYSLYCDLFLRRSDKKLASCGG
jgi:FkbM family methyltransferase